MQYCRGFYSQTSLPVRFKGREISLLINFFSFCVKKLSLKYFQDLVPSQSKFWKKNCSMISVAKWSNLGQVSTAPNLNVLCNTCRGTKKCSVAATFWYMILVRINLSSASFLSLWLENTASSVISILSQQHCCSGETDMLK